MMFVGQERQKSCHAISLFHSGNKIIMLSLYSNTDKLLFVDPPYALSSSSIINIKPHLILHVYSLICVCIPLLVLCIP